MTERTELTWQQAQERLKGVLEAAGIKATLSGCGCCGIFDFEFPDGAKFNDTDFYFECDGLSHQRGAPTK